MRARTPEHVKLVISLFTKEAALLSEALGRLIQRLGPVDLLSGPLEFGGAEYYRDEFGGPLTRKLASFENLVEPGELAGIKLFTNGVEDDLRGRDGKRRVNIDPGVLSLEKFVLASCKNFSHRIYLKDGVYADLTLCYRAGRWKALEWTYPDYRQGRMAALLTGIRKRYAFRLGRGLHDI